MKKFLAIVLVLVAVAAISACGGKGGKTLVSINGKAITEGELIFLGDMNPRLKAQISTPFGKKQILDNLVDQELLYQAAQKKGLQRDSSVKERLELYKKAVIGQAFVEKYVKNAAKEYYDKNKGDFEKLQLSDIMIAFGNPDPKADKKNAKPVRSKDAALKLANEVKAKLDGGAVFADVAKESSDDPMSKNNGGDLGPASKNEQRLESRGYGPLLEKAYTMKVGEIAGPIETENGYHVITVTKGLELQPFADVEQQIVFKIQGEERNKLMADLKKDAKINWPGEEKKEVKKAEAAKPASEAGNAPAKPEAAAPAKDEAKPEVAPEATPPAKK